MSIKVIPNAKKNRLGLAGTTYKCWLHAPAIDGKANAALILYFSEILRIPKRDIEIVRGETSREKVICIQGIEEEEIRVRLRSAMGS